MKKKLWMMILGIALCLNGCGEVEEKPQDKVVQEPEDSKETEPAPEVTEAPELTAAPEPDNSTVDVPDSTEPPIDVIPESGYLEVTFDYHYDSYFEDLSLMYGHFNTIHLHSKGYPALAKAVDEYNNIHITESQSYLDSLKDSAIWEYKEYGLCQECYYI